MADGLHRERAKNANPYRGGGNLYLSVAPRNDSVPQHGLDVALAQAVSIYYEKCRKASFVNGHRDRGRAFSQIAAMAKDMLRWLSKNPWTTLSAKQRAALEHTLKPERVAEVLANAKRAAGVGADMPECLWPENLPKKPPGRK